VFHAQRALSECLFVVCTALWLVYFAKVARRNSLLGKLKWMDCEYVCSCRVYCWLESPIAPLLFGRLNYGVVWRLIKMQLDVIVLNNNLRQQCTCVTCMYFLRCWNTFLSFRVCKLQFPIPYFTKFVLNKYRAIECSSLYCYIAPEGIICQTNLFN
jgi:hypothetical protein